MNGLELDAPGIGKRYVTEGHAAARALAHVRRAYGGRKNLRNAFRGQILMKKARFRPPRETPRIAEIPPDCSVLLTLLMTAQPVAAPGTPPNMRPSPAFTTVLASIGPLITELSSVRPRTGFRDASPSRIRRPEKSEERVLGPESL